MKFDPREQTSACSFLRVKGLEEDMLTIEYGPA